MGIYGLGLIGQRLVTLFRDRKPEGLQLVAATSRSHEAAERKLRNHGIDIPVLPLDQMVDCVDVVAEAAPAHALRKVAEQVLGADKTLICISAAGLLGCEDLLERTRTPGGGRLIIASGALPGIDAVRAAWEAGIISVSLENRLVPASLTGNGYVAAKRIDLASLTEPLTIFEGPAREGAQMFPRHFNVAVTLLMATRFEVDVTVSIVADPQVSQAIQTLRIDSEAGEFTCRASHLYTDGRRGARIVAPSIMAALRRLVDPVVAGS